MHPLKFGTIDRQLITLGTGIVELLQLSVPSTLWGKGSRGSHRIRKACG